MCRGWGCLALKRGLGPPEWPRARGAVTTTLATSQPRSVQQLSPRHTAHPELALSFYTINYRNIIYNYLPIPITDIVQSGSAPNQSESANITQKMDAGRRRKKDRTRPGSSILTPDPHYKQSEKPTFPPCNNLTYTLLIFVTCNSSCKGGNFPMG